MDWLNSVGSNRGAHLDYLSGKVDIIERLGRGRRVEEPKLACKSMVPLVIINMLSVACSSQKGDRILRVGELDLPLTRPRIFLTRLAIHWSCVQDVRDPYDVACVWVFIFFLVTSSFRHLELEAS